MSTRRFMVGAIPGEGEEVALPEAEARHAGRVLRLGAGDRLDLLDGAGVRAEAVVEQVEPGRHRVGMTCRVLQREVWASPRLAIRLYVAPPRARLMGEVIRVATELGVRRITPILCRYGVSRPDAGALDGWREDAVVAVKQCGNPFLPEFEAPVPFGSALAAAVGPGVYGAVPRSGRASAGWPAAGAVSLWIGPEGGLAPDEEQALEARGYAALSVGPWVLRVETAVPALLACLWGAGGASPVTGAGPG